MCFFSSRASREIHLENSLPWLQSAANPLRLVHTLLVHVTHLVPDSKCVCCFCSFKILLPFTKISINENAILKTQPELIMKFHCSSMSRCSFRHYFCAMISFWNRKIAYLKCYRRMSHRRHHYSFFTHVMANRVFLDKINWISIYKCFARKSPSSCRSRLSTAEHSPVLFLFT